ncbi:uroporphyrinogen decarboxylase [Acuticoccus mangrovi]|uniref:Uroporphyrinogen decarboxylase n=1 Tax=Acuticoccus mangrovi TaxID=2796142 RepID=A0A934ISD1_9HYPH|nr:uroporphyrinogen decarboxylase [Acuticoccus mangrovi]MBJ3777815.1 uroporphyrinogen decarboxylase [Acuticoccus mangrovi]
MDDAASASQRQPPLIAALKGETVRPAPVWFMRQAGRYLPEYRELRKQASGFLEFCYTPEMAVEATLQPMRRYAFDASIVFSDILVLPHALGQEVWFVQGEGPRLTPLADPGSLSFEGFESHLEPVYETIRRLRAALPAEKALLGFCGAPWTLATYMIAGRGGQEQWPARTYAARNPAPFAAMIDTLVEAAIRHLVRQIEAGADAVQIFDSWASALDERGFLRWSVEPIARIVAGVREAAPGVPIIGFPRGAGYGYTAFAERTGVDAVSLDWTVPMAAAREFQDRGICVQGNLDPAVLTVGGEALDNSVDHICAALKDGPFVFNLGHGISLETPPEHVTRVIERVKERTARR